MIGFARLTPRHERVLLPEGRLSGPMPWVLAIMLFLTALMAAAGVVLVRTASSISGEVAGRVTVQLIARSAGERAAAVTALRATLEREPYVARVTPVSEPQLRATMREWLGDDAMIDDLPVPALVDVDLQPGSGAAEFEQLSARLNDRHPGARIDAHSDWLGAVSRLIGAFAGLAAALIALMFGATVATVTLATRGALNTHYGTIEILHLIGSTDNQIARLFQRRIAIDALFGCGIGFVAALVVVVAVGWQFSAIGAGLVTTRATAIPQYLWLLLALLPILGVVIASLTARWTITRALRQIL